MTASYVLPKLINAVITFGVVLTPVLIASIFLTDSKERTFAVLVKRLFFLWINLVFFYLFLFAMCTSQRILNEFVVLCWRLNVDFLIFTTVINIIIIGILVFGKITVKYRKIHISKPMLALVFVPLFLTTGWLWFKEIFGMIPLEQLAFHITQSKSGANFNIVNEIIIKTVIDSAVLFRLLLSFLSIEITFKKQDKTLCFNPRRKKHWIFVIAGFWLANLCFFVSSIDIPFNELSLSRKPSTFYEENYIDPNSVEITFPAHKRNLMVIVIESLETGFLTREDGGAFKEDVIPEIKNMMKNNINFSASDSLGGLHQLYGTGWTIAAIVSQYSGVPLTVSLVNRTKGNYRTFRSEFLSGASGVGDILSKAGYKNYFFLGSKVEFAGRDKYFERHKDTVIYDYHYFLEHGNIPEDYYVWWGFEDRKLYSFAKEKIPEMAEESPFFITLLTVDTHPFGGYLDEKAVKVYDSHYKNVLFDADSQLSDFLEWFKKQEFYEDTTVVILGDHLYMDTSMVLLRNFQGRRFPVNIFINSLLSREYTKNRIFSHFDLFPTLIDSIGGIYDAKGLALGRSMHRGEPTLLEELGVDNVNKALRQRSVYYDMLWGQ